MTIIWYHFVNNMFIQERQILLLLLKIFLKLSMNKKNLKLIHHSKINYNIITHSIIT